MKITTTTTATATTTKRPPEETTEATMVMMTTRITRIIPIEASRAIEAIVTVTRKRS